MFVCVVMFRSSSKKWTPLNMLNVCVCRYVRSWSEKWTPLNMLNDCVCCNVPFVAEVVNSTYFNAWNFRGMKFSRFRGWNLKSVKLKCSQKCFFSSTAKLKWREISFSKQTAKLTHLWNQNATKRLMAGVRRHNIRHNTFYPLFNTNSLPEIM